MTLGRAPDAITTRQVKDRRGRLRRYLAARPVAAAVVVVGLLAAVTAGVTFAVGGDPGAAADGARGRAGGAGSQVPSGWPSARSESAGTSPSVPPSSGSPPAPPSAAPAAAPAPPAVRTAKKGVSAWYFDGVTGALADVKASWYYTWAATRGNVTAPAGVEFVPMIWGAGSVTASTLAQAKGQGGVLLGFNEPDMAGQANMSAARALELWPQLQATGARLGSPAVAYGADTPGGWLDQFMTGARGRGYRVDFIALHWYGSDFSSAATGQLKRYLQATYDRYHLPIWLTEYALIKFSGGGSTFPTADQQAAFVTASTAMLEGLSYVERYAWFALPTSKAGDTGLYSGANAPTAVGAAYRAAGPGR